LEHLDGLVEPLLGDVDEARVVESLDVLGVLGEGFAEEAEGLVVALVLVREDGLSDEHVRFRLLRVRRERRQYDEEQEQDCYALLRGWPLDGLRVFCTKKKGGLSEKSPQERV